MRHRSVVFVLISIMVLTASLQAAIPSSERQALIALYNAAGGDSWTNNSGWKTPPLDTDGFAMPGTENTWFGITTGSLNTTVTAINLASNNLIGSLPSEIAGLPNLTALNLRTNQLSGSVPSSLGNLTNLQILHLDGNLFTGSLPTELGNLTNLTILTLNYNTFTGSIPASFGNLIGLQDLLLDHNEFTGSLPTELGNLTSLEMLNCHLNHFSGSIPASLGNLTSLTSLLLHTNEFSGSIPAELGNLSNLELLYLATNELTGTIPASFGDLDNLIDLDLSHNQLSGSVPAELGDMASLQFLRLHFNELSGSIPAELGGLAALIEMTIQFNQLSGSLPAELGNLAALEVLHLHSNLLGGAIPAQLGALGNLEILYLQYNQLTGTIPTQLGNLGNLLYLRLDSNQLSGTIPAELGALPALIDLFLGDNQLEGTIPAALGNLANLEYLYLKSNKLGGEIPVALANLTILDPAGTDIGYNALYASDPTLVSFLNAKDPDWASTQTIAPSDVTATAVDGASIVVSWLPIAYTDHGGYYALYSSETTGGPYTLADQTANKTIATLQVNGLVPGHAYYFVVQTHTDAHAGNQNSIDSEYSEEAYATAWTQVSVRVSGTVTTGGSPLPDVEMSGLPTNPLTNSSGVYDVSVDAGWSGTVTPTLAGYTFTPTSRTYTGITEDQLNQDYTATFLQPTITVTSPNGGESWTAGSSQNVTWTATGLTGTVTIDLYKGGVYQKTLGTADVSAGTFAWAITAGETAGTDYRILVWQGGTSDDSDADFAITRTARVDFNNDGQEDILWRYYGTGGRNRVWFLGNTDPGTQPLLLADSQMETSASESSRDTGSRATFTDPGEVRIIPNPRGRLIVADPREAVDTKNWTEAHLPAADPGKAGISMPEMDALSLGPVVLDPGYAMSAVNPSGTSSGLIEIAATTGVLGGADILAVPDLTWQAMGTGDFNNDGKTDVLWRHNGTGGRVRVWYMDGTSVIAGADIGSVSDLDWRIVGTGDFNQDGSVDLLWHHGVSGRVRVWYLNGISIIAGADVSTVSDLNWKVMGTGDFNSDGQVDILWRHSVSGRDRVWFMNGISILSGADLIAVTDQNWQIAGTGDYNGDGDTDVLWRYNGSGGYVYIWYLNGTSWIGTEKLIAVPDLNWKIVSR